jgi:hypothetical protein
MAALLLIMGGPLRAQLPVSSDTLRALAPDTLHADTVAADTLKKKKEDIGVDTLVNYSADQIDFDVLRRITVLTGRAVVTYKDMRLEAGRISVDWDAQMLTAEPLPDTLFSDSLRTVVDTVLRRELPHFSQAGENFFGDEIAYNMKSKIGRVRGGMTNFDDGYYYGQQLKRVASDVLTVKDGKFTTCNQDPPHYYFAAKELKVLVGKRVVARPVILYFCDVPVLAVPFGIFPQQHGRTSGILIPTFGESGSQGRFLRDLGYYFALSDYTDLRTSVDFFERYGFLGRSNFRYNKRDVLSGSTDFDFNATSQGGTRRRDYSIQTTHNQIINQYTRLSASGRYVSNQSFNESVGTVQDLLNQSVQSNATLTRSWEYWPWSLAVNAGYTQNLRINTWSATLPAINFAHKSGLLFPPPKAPRHIRGATAPRELHPPWYRTFAWSYNVVYRNELSLPHAFKEEGIRLAGVDSTGQAYPQSTILGNDSLSVFQKDGLVHSGGISANARLFEYFNFNPRIGLSGLTTRRIVDYRYIGNGTLDREDRNGFFQRLTFDLSGSVNTKLYGLLNKPFGLGASFRHVLTPTVGFTYRPDFKDPKWGYFKTIELPDGNTFIFDRFRGQDQMSAAGGTPVGRSERFSFSLDHLFQMKTGDEEKGTEKKYDLLSWDMGTGFDARKDSLKWDNLGMSWRTSVPGQILGPIQGLNVDVSTSHSLYTGNENGARYNQFYWERKDSKWYAPLDLTNAAINVGFNVKVDPLGSLFGITKEKKEGAPDTTQQAVTTEMPNVPISPAQFPDHSRAQPEPPPSPLAKERGPSELYQMPLSLTVSLRQSRDYTRKPTSKTSGMALRMTFNLTPKWTTSMDYTMDLDRKSVNNVGVFVTRDLHCWEASFQWSPLGFRPGYFLRIGLKSPQLRDVKMERHRGAGFGGYY